MRTKGGMGMQNGTCWMDDRGLPIQAHGGMILEHGGTYYWYGENKDAPNRGTRVDVVGISCYTSKDLVTWHHEGLALAADPEDETNPLHPSKVCERPKVLYNERTGQFVMWFHADTAGYTLAMAGCAVSDNPVGPFRLLGIQSPNRRDCRDMTLYRDKDGTAYLVHSGDWNKTLYFSQLTDDFLGFTGVCHAAMVDQEREAPALYYKDGLHYCVTSGCTGWEPNSALYSVSRHLSNGMKLIDNPCSGPNYRKTFFGQSTYILEIQGKPHLILDHWKPQDLKHSGYSILPMEIDGLHMDIPWKETFDGLK